MTRKACAVPNPGPDPGTTSARVGRSVTNGLRAAVAAPLRGYLSGQSARPHGPVGRLLGRVWIRETAAVNDIAIELLNPSTGDRILEIGFGPGRTLRRLADAGAEVDGVDISPAMLCLAARRNTTALTRGVIRLHTGDGTALPAGDRSLDAVIGVHTIYFWPDPATTATEIARTLRPGGRVVLAFRDGAAPLPPRLDPRTYKVPTIQTATTWLQDAGLTEITAHRRAEINAPIVWLTATAAATGGHRAA